MDLSDDELEHLAAADRREVEQPIQVDAACSATVRRPHERWWDMAAARQPSRPATP